MDGGSRGGTGGALGEHRPLLGSREKTRVLTPVGKLGETRQEILAGRLVARVDSVDEVEAGSAAEER